jgi:molybdenum cofactor biosynthesis enzyme MoaA
MKTHTFSVVVGDARCNANCPFCVAKMTAADFSDYIDFDRGRFDIACRIVEQMREGLLTVMLTGQGEPLLFPEQITRYMDVLVNRFPRIELQTNGTLVQKNLDNLRRWRDKGLTLVCLSIADNSDAVSNSIMRIKDRSYNYWRTADTLQDLGLNVRLNCTMTKAGTYRPEECEYIINRAKNANILQTTFREVEQPEPVTCTKTADWVTQNKPHGAAVRLHHYLALNGAVRLLELPHGGVVYDFKDQNVAIGNCLTGTTNPDDIRQVIFFPDGRVAYDWRYKGARLL